ncbi:elongation factor P 5-aminopentanone reductase [Terrisporobacter sp.]|uniref:elongation factor P 5-aminopentanone reductase n=1 Tax=Terrisporobacter sp. TaxID=1965305 RepID=UPI002624D4BE|nr:3-oxoacyl-ACP reductase FabG [Terrisporobacter sp.]
MNTKKTALITGASRGIGREVAKLFAKNNYNVVINYNKSEKEAQDLLEELNNENLSVRIFKADISNPQEANSLVNYTIGQFERIDVLINNAGISKFNLFTDISYEEWHEVMNVNLNSVFYVTKKALQYMIPELQGKIINISSIWGIVGASNEVHYSASKAALIGMTKALAKELGPSNIQVNAIAPGVIETDMIKDIDDDTIDMLKYDTPLMRIGKPIDIAKCALFLAQDGGDFITGQVISSNGGFVIY